MSVVPLQIGPHSYETLYRLYLKPAGIVRVTGAVMQVSPSAEDLGSGEWRATALGAPSSSDMLM